MDEMAGEFVDLIDGESTHCDRRSLAPYQYCICHQKIELSRFKKVAQPLF
jgi:hypothetical protein